jgi:hypothetical protein
MTNKKNLAIFVLAAFCLAATLLMIMPVESASVWPYDPWADLNDDGKIDLKEVYEITKRYGALGTPINKTALLIEVNATFTQLLAEIQSLNALVAKQQSRIAELESEIAILNATKLGEPDWQRWVTIPPGQYASYQHNLGTTDVLVYVVGYDYDGYGYHQINYGGDSTAIGSTHGIWWYDLTVAEVTIYRLPDDVRWDLIHIMIWKIPEP